ncbi:hypothetical protein K501DRAFT_268247 [Backusella circina FSU 941]|nr:hypothetical protein K501DRAFT_268247 [Backusella circina FSU 941]
MKTLTTLRINHCEPILLPIHLVNCLYACPTTLKYLSIYSNRFIIDPCNTILDPIETLNITSNELIRGLEKTISSCFFNFVTLAQLGYFETYNWIVSFAEEELVIGRNNEVIPVR